MINKLSCLRQKEIRGFSINSCGPGNRCGGAVAIAQQATITAKAIEIQNVQAGAAAQGHRANAINILCPGCSKVQVWQQV
jgi:hypothetical protein